MGLCNFHDSMVQAFDSGQFYGLTRLCLSLTLILEDGAGESRSPTWSIIMLSSHVARSLSLFDIHTNADLPFAMFAQTRTIVSPASHKV